MPTPKPEKKKIKNEKNSNINSVKKWAWDNMPSPDVITKNNDIINCVKKCARDNRPSTNVIIPKSMKNMHKSMESNHQILQKQPKTMQAEMPSTSAEGHKDQSREVPSKTTTTTTIVVAKDEQKEEVDKAPSKSQDDPLAMKDSRDTAAVSRITSEESQLNFKPANVNDKVTEVIPFPEVLPVFAMEKLAILTPTRKKSSGNLPSKTDKKRRELEIGRRRQRSLQMSTRASISPATLSPCRVLQPQPAIQPTETGSQLGT